MKLPCIFLFCCSLIAQIGETSAFMVTKRESTDPGFLIGAPTVQAFVREDKSAEIIINFYVKPNSMESISRIDIYWPSLIVDGSLSEYKWSDKQNVSWANYTLKAYKKRQDTTLIQVNFEPALSEVKYVGLRFEVKGFAKNVPDYPHRFMVQLYYFHPWATDDFWYVVGNLKNEVALLEDEASLQILFPNSATPSFLLSPNPLLDQYTWHDKNQAYYRAIINFNADRKPMTLFAIYEERIPWYENSLLLSRIALVFSAISIINLALSAIKQKPRILKRLRDKIKSELRKLLYWKNLFFGRTGSHLGGHQQSQRLKS